MNKQLYIVKYTTGSNDSYDEINIFVTHSKSKATKYVTKFNKMVKKWRDYYQQFEDNNCENKWIKDEFTNQHFNRWYMLREINKCSYEEIGLR